MNLSPILFVCLFDWALDSEIQLWVGPCCGVQPLAQGVGMFVRPLLPHLLRERPANRSVDLIRERVLGDHTVVFVLIFFSKYAHCVVYTCRYKRSVSK